MPKPRPLLHATNAALALLRPRTNTAQEWERMTERCVDEFGFMPVNAQVEALHRLLAESGKEPDLSPMGRYSFSQVHVWARLRNVAQVHHLHAAEPDIARENVDDPIFVVGLPRTATTLTHQLLADAPGHRGPLMAEMHSTRTSYPEWEADVRRASRQITQLYRYEPYFKRIHPMDATAPEETFFAEVATRYFLCSAPLPGYRQWLDATDAKPWYQWLRMVLQVLQYGRQPKGQAPRRWVLKQPGHLWHLPELMQVFPRATVVWTHRDPVTSFGSACSMIEAMRRMHLRSRVFRHRENGTSGLTEIGDLWLELLAEAIERGRAARAQLPADAVIDVPYHQLTSDPDTTVPALFDRLGVPWTNTQAERMRAFFNRPQGRTHEYNLSRYGQHPDRVTAAFGDYPDHVARMNARMTL